MKKNKLIFLQVFIAFVLICTSVYAATTTISLDVSKTSFNRGDTVTVTLSLKDVDSSKKVESIEGYVNYNTNVIEPITVDSIHKGEDNTVKIGNETLKVEDLTGADVNEIPSSSSYVAFNGKPSAGNNSRIVIDFKDGLIKEEKLLEIDFKVKTDATTGEIKNAISYSMFLITTGSEQSQEITKTIDLTITKPSGNTGDGDNDQDKDDGKNENKNENQNKNQNKNENKNTNKPNENVNRNSNKNNDNTVSGVLPATGTKMLVVPAIVLAIVALVFYSRYVKYKDV